MSEPALGQVLGGLILTVPIQTQREQVDRVGALRVVGIEPFGDEQGCCDCVGVQGLPDQRPKLRDNVRLRDRWRHVGDICRHESDVRSRLGALVDVARGRDGGDLTQRGKESSLD